jgi:hypothetical protein
MIDWRRKLAADIRALLGPSGAEEVQITILAAQADQLVRGLEMWANFTDHREGPHVRAVGARGVG